MRVASSSGAKRVSRRWPTSPTAGRDRASPLRRRSRCSNVVVQRHRASPVWVGGPRRAARYLRRAV